jgi:hypothetical protein
MEFEISKELKEVSCNIVGGEFDKMSQVMSNLIANINNQKQQILKDKLEELGIEIDWELEQTRRFKSILIEHHADTGHEVYYYNDGTKKGQRVVTFALKKEITPIGSELTMGYTYF